MYSSIVVKHSGHILLHMYKCLARLYSASLQRCTCVGVAGHFRLFYHSAADDRFLFFPLKGNNDDWSLVRGTQCRNCVRFISWGWSGGGGGGGAQDIQLSRPPPYNNGRIWNVRWTRERGLHPRPKMEIISFSKNAPLYYSTCLHKNGSLVVLGGGNCIALLIYPIRFHFSILSSTVRKHASWDCTVGLGIV